MKRFVWIFCLIGFIFTVNNCVIFSGGAVLKAANEINASVLSAENESFQKEAEINLTIVKRGLWSMQSTYKNSMIELYYKSLLDNRLVYSVDNSKNEFAQQNHNNDTIGIVINGQYQDYTEFEKAILLIVSTSTLALLRDSNFNKNEVPNMFFKFIGEYNPSEILGIINAQWFKNKSITIIDDSIVIG
jgi:hypothetical protein